MQKVPEAGQEGQSQATQNKLCKSHTLDSTYVVDSRVFDGYVRRRRKCRICDIRIYTEEKIVAEGSNPWSVKRTRKLKKAKRPRKRVLTPHVKRVREQPDFDKMTDEQIEAWIFEEE